VKLILIRHPETEANAKRLIYGRKESEYTEKGRALCGDRNITFLYLFGAWFGTGTVYCFDLRIIKF